MLIYFFALVVVTHCLLVRVGAHVAATMVFHSLEMLPCRSLRTFVVSGLSRTDEGLDVGLFFKKYPGSESKLFDLAVLLPRVHICERLDVTRGRKECSTRVSHYKSYARVQYSLYPTKALYLCYKIV